MAKTIEIDIDVNADDAAKGVDKLGSEFDKLNESTDKTATSQDKLNDSLNVVGGGLAGAAQGAKGLLAGFKALIMSPIGLVIGALATALYAVKRAFEDSETGQNKFAKIMSVIGAITGNFIDLLADLGDLIIDAFENPREALESFSKMLKDNIVNRFNGLLELIPNLGKAISLVFKGDFVEAGEVATNAVAKVALGIDDVTGKLKQATEATKEFIKEQEREGKLAAEVADKRAEADIIERDLIVQRSKLQSEIALLRLKSRQEDEFSATQRREALIEAQKLEEILLDAETEVLELRRDAQITENTFSRSNKENLDAEAKARAAVNNQVAARANVSRQLQRELNTISKQVEAEEKAAKALKAAEEKEAETLRLEDKKIKDDAEILAAQNKKDELDKIAQENKDRLDKEVETERVANETKANLQKQYLNSVSKGVSVLVGLAGKNRAAQAVGIIAENAAGIAKMVISNNIANTAALASPANILVPGSAAPIIAANNVTTGINIAASVAATAKGLAALKKGGSAGSKPTLPSGGGSASAPNISTETLQTNNDGNLPQTFEVGNQNAGANQIRAVVLESDITDSQNRINDIENSSEIGG